jgi:hypothetical protein
MLEEILIECVVDMIADPNMNYSFDSDIGPGSIKILSHRKEKLGLEYFHIASALVDGEKTNFYISRYRLNRIIEARRSKNINEILDGSDNRRK